jgi:L-ribulose-5-phosphate 3-epimerase
MISTPAHRVGVCSWSLRPPSADDLAKRVGALGLSAVQLALDPIRRNDAGWGEIETLNALRSHGLSVLSGMMGMAGEDYSTLESIRRTGGVRPQATWGENLRAAQANARLARRLGIGLVTFHAGFIPHDSGPERRAMIERLRMMIDHFDDCGVRVAFETGQESADTLLEALGELNRPHAGVNFDPANMILYGMGDPVAALKRLASRVVQLHIKDAVPTRQAGEWGDEVPAGRGAVCWAELFDAVRSCGLAADLVIEREAGEGRDADIAAARDLLAKAGFAAASGRGGEA